jgi:hypothetical protein
VRVAAEKDFRAAFGDSVIYTEPYSISDMKSRIGQRIVYLPVGNRTGSIKIFNFVTGAIVTRDSFDIIPTTNTTIKFMNDLAALDGRFMPKMSHAVHDLIYNQSVNQANMPSFTPVQPPLRDIGIMALIPDEPHTHPSQPLILADTIEQPPDVILDVLQHDEGGGSEVPVLPDELAIPLLEFSKCSFNSTMTNHSVVYGFDNFIIIAIYNVRFVNSSQYGRRNLRFIIDT